MYFKCITFLGISWQTVISRQVIYVSVEAIQYKSVHFFLMFQVFCISYLFIFLSVF